jgi:D-glycero-D-manno-heptose 1,7-bisphosphate phosphatase
MIDQVAILCGGKGTRLGELTSTTPKPLLPVGGEPFLGRLLMEVRRHGFRRILLLAGFQSDQINAFARDAREQLAVEIDVSVEPALAGTGGALAHARDLLDETFILLNGDSWFDINLLDFAVRTLARPWAEITFALRPLADTHRSGTVRLAEDRIVEFLPRPVDGGPGLVNGGVYVVRRGLVETLPDQCSLEEQIIPRLAREGRAAGFVYDSFFIDIGVPAAYAEGQATVPARQRRPGAFLDRDGILNRDLGHVGTVDRFEWCDGAISAVKDLNDRGHFVFVVTNQAGVARGLYSEDDVRSLHAHMQAQLRAEGAHIDDFRYCPFHPDGSVPAYAISSDCRKPAPGMILDLMASWPVVRERSYLIGNSPSDIEAAHRAGIEGVLVEDCGLFAEVTWRRRR